MPFRFLRAELAIAVGVNRRDVDLQRLGQPGRLVAFERRRLVGVERLQSIGSGRRGRAAAGPIDEREIDHQSRHFDRHAAARLHGLGLAVRVWAQRLQSQRSRAAGRFARLEIDGQPHVGRDFHQPQQLLLVDPPIAVAVERVEPRGHQRQCRARSSPSPTSYSSQSS